MIETTQTLPQGGFDEQAESTLYSVRTAFAEIIEAIPGRVTRPTDVSKTLEIDKQLAWKVTRLSEATTPLEIARHVPGNAAVEIFLVAASSKGIRGALIDAARKAVQGFTNLIEVHAGDRASLEMMLADSADQGRERLDGLHGRAAFRANSYLWGVQARAQLKADFLVPSEKDGYLDIASLRGFVGLRRLRSNVPWIIARMRCTTNEGVPRPAFLREPIDPYIDDATQVPLLRDFCSEPLSSFRRVSGSHGFLEDEIVEGPVGETAAVTCITGEVGRAVGPRYQEPRCPYGELIVRMRTPCESLVFDQIVHEDLFGPISPQLAVYGELARWAPYPECRDELPVQETVEYLGKGPSVLHTRDVPRYADMARHVFKRLGWDGERFDVYRVRMQFPPIPTSIVMRQEMPMPPGA